MLRMQQCLQDTRQEMACDSTMYFCSGLDERTGERLNSPQRGCCASAIPAAARLLLTRRGRTTEHPDFALASTFLGRRNASALQVCISICRSLPGGHDIPILYMADGKGDLQNRRQRARIYALSTGLQAVLTRKTSERRAAWCGLPQRLR
jgi:hypothetical protein